jgi:mono/diheme cytochrome c family protein
MLRWLRIVAVATALAVLTLPGGRAAGQADGDVARGEATYQASCAMCHGADATGMTGMRPALTGVVQRLTVEGVEVAIRNGRDTRPPMPAFGNQLDDADIADLIAYLDTLPSGRALGPEATGRDGMMGGQRMLDRMMERGWGWALAVVALLLLVLVAVVLVVVVNQRGPDRRGDLDGDADPRAILDRRYAAGELSREQYQQARKDLEG